MFTTGEQIPGGEKRKRREARKMKAVRLRVALTSALAVFLAATAGQAQAGAQDVHATAGSIEAKLEYCTTCHGLSAQGFRGFYAMPRLAGQQPQYIENQLRAFLDRRRLNPVMANVAHGITPDMIPVLAARVSALNPPPVDGAPRGDVALGREIFANGLPDQNVPACSACHGPDAKGQREIPRLAGQLYWYMVSTLSLWSSERGQGGREDISWIMRPTVANLTRKQVEALAEYVSALR
jgi:cytochrome c553